jgi:hypothetical protein
MVMFFRHILFRNSDSMVNAPSPDTWQNREPVPIHGMSDRSSSPFLRIAGSRFSPYHCNVYILKTNVPYLFHDIADIRQVPMTDIWDNSTVFLLYSACKDNYKGCQNLYIPHTQRDDQTYLASFLFTGYSFCFISYLKGTNGPCLLQKVTSIHIF